MLSLQFGLAEISSNSMALMEILCLLVWSFGIFVYYCDVGQMVTTQFDLFEIELRQCDWHLYPLQLKQMLVTFMVNSQNKTIIRGFARSMCTRESLMEVNKIVYGLEFDRQIISLFLYFRRLDQPSHIS